MRIETARHLTHQRLDLTTPDESRQGSVNQDSADDRKPGRELVMIGTPPTPEPASSYRQAAFLAQLIATREQAQQTRDRRRAEPMEALAAYRAAAALV